MPAYRVEGHIWVAREGGGPFLGPGRIALLRKIDELGSIRAAAKALKMSYRRAWRHIESLNREAPVPLVVTAIGGRGGGGATLTPAGYAVLELFEHIERRFQKFLEEETKKLHASLNSLPS